MIEREDIICFLNKKVKLVKSDGFVLYGVIIKINKSSIFFKTTQAESVIDFENIKEITTNNRGRW